MTNVYQQSPILSPRIIRLVFVIYISSFTTSFAALRKLQEATKRDGSLQFLVVGDWGRRGFFNQSAVALQMGRVAEKLEINFVVSTGDNFYDDGLKDVNDPAFEESFMNVYTAKSLQKPWYNVLGNHDYRGDTEALLSPILRKKDHRWFCQRFYVVNAGIAHLFFVDTTPFVDNYFIEVDHSYDWRAVSPRKKYLTHVLKDLESSVKESTAKWKIVIGHHTIRSAGHHGDTKELVQNLLPLLEANDIDFYINGHDHCLEHISSPHSALQYLTSGGGSKAWRGDVKTLNQQDIKFFYDGQGFMSMKLTKTEAELMVYDIFGKVLHKWKVSKQFHTDM